MTGFESLYGSMKQAAEGMKSQIRSDLNITASVGIASSKVAAKVASDLDKPDGLVEVPPRRRRRFPGAHARRGDAGRGRQDGEAA